jgi:hypothetical protein
LSFIFGRTRRLAEDRADVQQAKAAHLEEIAQQRGAASFERGCGDVRDLDDVVGRPAHGRG